MIMGNRTMIWVDGGGYTSNEKYQLRLVRNVASDSYAVYNGYP
jgi:hypothetical protein